MTRARSLALLMALPLVACSSDSPPPTSPTSPTSDSPAAASNTPAPPRAGEPAAEPNAAASPQEALEALRTNVAATAARSELDGVTTMKVAHILVAFQGATRSTATRSKAEAEQYAADLLARIEAGEDFLALMAEASDDPGPGVYGMTSGAPSAGYYPRGQMAGAFGDTGWRLEVGEVGVAAYDPQQSPFGWHIIKRTE